MEVENSGQLMRAVLHATRIIVQFRAMRPTDEIDWISGYAEMLERIDNLEPHTFDAVAASFVTLILMHNGTAQHDWLRPVEKQARKKKKKKGGGSKKRKSKNKQPSNDDDDNEDEDGDENNNADDEEDQIYESSVSAAERAEIDATITNSVDRPAINVNGMAATQLEQLTDSYFSFVPFVQPLLFEASRKDVRPHDGVNYGLLMVVQTCGSSADIATMMEKCRKRLVKLRRESYARLDYANEDDLKCRVMLLLWDGKLIESKQDRLCTKVRKLFNYLNAERQSGITYEFFTVSQLQHDVTKGNADQFTVLHKDASGKPDQFVIQNKTVVATTKEEQAHLKTIKTFQMRKLERHDPQAAIRDFIVGQRIRITRSHVHLGGSSVEYAQVVDSSI